MGVLQFQKAHGVSLTLILRQGACNITKALETLKFSSWPGSMEWSHGQSFWEAFPVTQRLPQVDAFQKWIRCGRTCLGSDMGFPIEKRWFLVVRRICFFFFANRSCFSTTRLDSIPSSRFSFHPFSHLLSAPKCLLEIKLPIFTRVGSGPTSKQASTSSPSKPQDSRKPPRIFEPFFGKERSRDPYKWPLYVMFTILLGIIRINLHLPLLLG